MRLRIIVVIFLMTLLPQTLWALTGKEIMEESKKLTTPTSAKVEMQMDIYKGKRSNQKLFTIFSKSSQNEEDKILISFHKPTHIKLLTHAFKNREDDQWLVMSSGRVKRITSSDKGKPFVHSHFYYEDLASRDLDDYTYTHTGDESVLGVECYKVAASKPGAKKNVYDKLMLYVRKSDYYIIRIDFYQNNKLIKFMENHDIKPVDNILTPFRVVMNLADGRERTELTVKDIHYNGAIENAMFNKEALR